MSGAIKRQERVKAVQPDAGPPHASGVFSNSGYQGIWMPPPPIPPAGPLGSCPGTTIEEAAWRCIS